MIALSSNELFRNLTPRRKQFVRWSVLHECLNLQLSQYSTLGRSTSKQVDGISISVNKISIFLFDLFNQDDKVQDIMIFNICSSILAISNLCHITYLSHPTPRHSSIITLIWKHIMLTSDSRNCVDSESWLFLLANILGCPCYKCLNQNLTHIPHL